MWLGFAASYPVNWWLLKQGIKEAMQQEGFFPIQLRFSTKDTVGMQQSPSKQGEGLRVQRLFIAPGHNYFRRHGQGAADYPITEMDQVECVAGHGLRGDRFFDYKDNYKGQITFFSQEVFAALQQELRLAQAEAAATRRNVLVSGVDLNQLIGVQFELQGLRFEGTEECRPCYWMNSALGPGAEEWLKGRGGLRARILTDGILRRQ